MKLFLFKILLIFGLSLMSASAFAQQTWQQVVPSAGAGAGGASYTAWGTTTCATASGYTPAYTGQAIFPIIAETGGTALGSVICSGSVLTLNLPTNLEPLWATGDDNPITTTLEMREATISCAVCVK